MSDINNINISVVSVSDEVMEPIQVPSNCLADFRVILEGIACGIIFFVAAISMTVSVIVASVSSMICWWFPFAIGENHTIIPDSGIRSNFIITTVVFGAATNSIIFVFRKNTKNDAIGAVALSRIDDITRSTKFLYSGPVDNAIMKQALENVYPEHFSGSYMDTFKILLTSRKFVEQGIDVATYILPDVMTLIVNLVLGTVIFSIWPVTENTTGNYQIAFVLWICTLAGSIICIIWCMQYITMARIKFIKAYNSALTTPTPV